MANKKSYIELERQMIDKQYLIDFETEVKERYEAGEIKAPVHLASNNEDEL